MPVPRRVGGRPPSALEASAERPRFDFHSHTFLTDGTTSATDMWLHADRLGHRVLAVTDHVSLDDPRPLIKRLRSEAKAFEDGPMVPFVGVEVSMVAPARIAQVARAARRAGAQIVIVHGETPAEPVPAGTNHAAIDCRDVDLLAHPGLLDPKDAELARDHGTFLELSGRRGHSLANGHVARVALSAGADLVVDSDAHSPDQLLGIDFARKIAAGAGLSAAAVQQALSDAPNRLAERLRKR
jgi:putative hydrolase